MKKGEHEELNMSWPIAFYTYFIYTMLITVGHVRDFFGNLTGLSRYVDKTRKPGYSILFSSWENFFTRRMFHRIQDCWARPIRSAPGSHIEVIERVSNDLNRTFIPTENSSNCLNLGSYNYLGFADDWKISCRKSVMEGLEKWPLSLCSSRLDHGTISLHEELERTVADFLGKEAAVVYAMGYDTNASTIPAIMGPESLIISDSLNHTSIVNGARSSSSQIRVFRHNDTRHLEEVLREAIINGQPRHHRPWKKIMVMVEGIYSMEGDISNLPEIVRICKKYKVYLYVDEAHSIGALGKSGRGVCEQTGVDPKDVDILMGTFTKSFSGMGGYIAGSQELIDFIKANSAGALYHNSMSPIICQQVLTAFNVIMGKDGTDIGKQKLQALRDNSNYFRKELTRIGLEVLGNDDSPIIPVMLYVPTKIAVFSRECLKRGLAVVVVGFPAVSVLTGRSRFCISAGHKREDLEEAIRSIEEVAELIQIKYKHRFLG